jgi:hypothetical protein
VFGIVYILNNNTSYSRVQVSLSIAKHHSNDFERVTANQIDCQRHCAVLLRFVILQVVFVGVGYAVRDRKRAELSCLLRKNSMHSVSFRSLTLFGSREILRYRMCVSIFPFLDFLS